MIDFRYHVVSIVAVFLALTVGLVLGASFLQGAAVQNLNGSINSLTTQRNNLQQANRTLNNQINGLNSYINTTAPFVLQSYLRGMDVSVVEISGSDPALTAATLQLLGAAGARITSDVTITPRFTATDSADQANLAAAVVSTLQAGQGPANGPAAVQAAALLAEALTTQPIADNAAGNGAGTGGTGTGNAIQPTTTPTAPTGTPGTAMTWGQAQGALTSLGTGGFITVNTVPPALKATDLAKPSLTFIAAPTTVDTAAQNAAFITLAEDLRSGGATPVMGGAAENDTAGSVQPGGLLDAVLKDGTASKQIATVDDMNLTPGQVAVVGTLWEAHNNALTGYASPAKHYGTVGGATQGQMPPISPLPTPTPTGTGAAGTSTGSTPAS